MDTDIILDKEETVADGIKRTYVSKVEDGAIVILKEKGRRGLNAQFTILDWPNWMPKTDALFNNGFYTARSWKTIEFYIKRLFLNS